MLENLSTMDTFKYTKMVYFIHAQIPLYARAYEEEHHVYNRQNLTQFSVQQDTQSE